MSNHFYSQHAGLGIASEPLQNSKSQELYDTAAREYRVLMSQGLNNDENRNRGSNPSRDVLLPEGAGRGRSLCPRERLLPPVSDEGRAGGEVHADRSYGPWEIPVRGDQRGSDSRLTFPLKVKVLIGCVIAVFSSVVVMICLFIRSVMLLKGISLMSGLPWVLGAIAAYALLLLLFVALMKIAAASDRRMAEMGGSR